jgi:hypothetical protein
LPAGDGFADAGLGEWECEDGGGSAVVGAAAFAASSADGTDTGAVQYGHFTRFPADSSRARNRFEHEGHPSVIGMAFPKCQME